jgi:hypothetical protein
LNKKESKVSQVRK